MSERTTRTIYVCPDCDMYAAFAEDIRHPAACLTISDPERVTVVERPDTDQRCPYRQCRHLARCAGARVCTAEMVPAPNADAVEADHYDATNSVRLCNRCEDESGVTAGADKGDRACAVCGQHAAPHIYPARKEESGAA